MLGHRATSRGDHPQQTDTEDRQRARLRHASRDDLRIKLDRIYGEIPIHAADQKFIIPASCPSSDPARNARGHKIGPSLPVGGFSGEEDELAACRASDADFR